MRIDKPWGFEDLIHQGFGYAVKIIQLNSQMRTSLHYHVEKHETIVVQSGLLVISIGSASSEHRSELVLTPGQFISVQPGIIHRMSSLDEAAVYVEAQTDHLEDVVRLSDDHLRVT